MLYYGGIGAGAGGLLGLGVAYLMSESESGAQGDGIKGRFVEIFGKIKPLVPKGNLDQIPEVESLAHRIQCILELADLQDAATPTKTRLQLYNSGQELVGQLRLLLDQLQQDCKRKLTAGAQEEFLEYETQLREELSLLSERVMGLAEAALQ